MKITGQVERIFAQAVALDQSGGLKNAIYASGREIIIINFDYTVLLRFRLRGTEAAFEHPISFKANDYDSNEFEEQDGRIIFTTEQSGYKRKKTCGTAEMVPDEAKTLLSHYLDNSGERQLVVIDRAALSLLDDDLSHIEFSGKKGEPLKMIQRNVYSGGVVEVMEANDSLFQQTLSHDFGPVGIRTNDFKALFTFQDQLRFEFPAEENDDFIIVRSIQKDKRDMVGVIAACVYDEIVELKEARVNAVLNKSNKVKRQK